MSELGPITEEELRKKAMSLMGHSFDCEGKWIRLINLERVGSDAQRDEHCYCGFVRRVEDMVSFAWSEIEKLQKEVASYADRVQP